MAKGQHPSPTTRSESTHVPSDTCILHNVQGGPSVQTLTHIAGMRPQCCRNTNRSRGGGGGLGAARTLRTPCPT